MSEEISLSIEETNAIREKLGLKPLLIVENSDLSLNLSVSNRIPKLKSTKDDDYREENKRLFDDIAGGGSILDSLGDVEANSDLGAHSEKRIRVNHEDGELSEEVDSSSSESSSSHSSSDSENN